MSVQPLRLEEIMAESDSQEALVRSILNILLESPYFYKKDDPSRFLALQRNKRAFAAFFEKFYGWELLMDARCARLYKPKWYNERITAANRDMFNLTRRDDCIAFALLLEFFERELQNQAATTDDADPLRFRYGSLLEFEARRFRELFRDRMEKYGDEAVRRILRDLMPTLLRYRFLEKVPPPPDESVADEDTIYECLPALWHYQSTQLAVPVKEDSSDGPRS